jgi:hypothetical protein
VAILTQSEDWVLGRILTFFEFNMTKTALSDESGDVPRSWYQVTIAVEPGRGQNLDEDSSSNVIRATFDKREEAISLCEKLADYYPDDRKFLAIVTAKDENGETISQSWVRSSQILSFHFNKFNEAEDEDEDEDEDEE